MFFAIFLTVGFGLPDCAPSPPLPSIDGEVDPRSYPPGVSSLLSNSPNVVAMTADQRTGYIFLGGAFTAMNSIIAHNIVTLRDWNDYAPLSAMGIKNDGFGTGVVVVRALAISGNYLYVGGEFSQTQDGSVTNMNNIARYNIDTGEWTPLSENGLNGTVRALAISGDQLYVGGDFSQSFSGATTNLNKIARYDTSTGVWSQLSGNGLNNNVFALAVSGNDLFVGGSFSRTSDFGTVNLNSIARYDTSNGIWSPLPGAGLNNWVYSLAVSSGDLFAGGDFVQTFDGSTTGLSKIGRFGISTGTWSPLAGSGLDGAVFAIAVSGDVLSVGGEFTRTIAGYISRYVAIYRLDTDMWESLPNGITDRVYSTAIAHTPEFSGDILYLGGGFRGVYNGAHIHNGFASFYVPDNSQGSTGAGATPVVPLPLGYQNGIALNDEVRSLAAGPANSIFAGGYFTKTADERTLNLNYIARFDPANSTWNPLANNGLLGSAETMAIAGDNLYVGGAFSRTFDGNVTNLNRIARYNLTTNTWSPLANNGLNGIVRSMAIHGDYLYVGGTFTRTFDGIVTNLNRIARYNLTTNTWSPLTGNGLNGEALAMTMSGDVLYVGGAFTQTFDGSVFDLNYVARYDTVTETWQELSDLGLNSIVNRMETLGTSVFMHGDFTQTFNTGQPLQQLANYHTTKNTWTPITGNAATIAGSLRTNAAVRSGNEVYIGGSFQGTERNVAIYFTRIYLQKWAVPAVTTDWFDNANWTTGSSPVANSNAVIPAGSGSINISSADVSMHDLMVNGGNINIGTGRSLTINGILGLYGGTITGEGTVVIANCKPDGIMGGGPAAYIRTALVRCMDETGIFIYPVGTAAGYSPVTANVSSLTGLSQLAVKASEGNRSGMDPNRSAQRYWTLTETGDLTANLSFKYLDSDVNGNESGYRLYRFSGGLGTAVTPFVLNTFANRAYTSGVSSFSEWAIGSLAPTAASVSVGGRVVSAAGHGIVNATISVIDMNGNTRTALTNPFGYYRIDGITVGSTYVVSAVRKGCEFADQPRVVSVDNEIADLDFVAVAGGFLIEKNLVKTDQDRSKR